MMPEPWLGQPLFGRCLGIDVWSVPWGRGRPRPVSAALCAAGYLVFAISPLYAARSWDRRGVPRQIAVPAGCGGAVAGTGGAGGRGDASGYVASWDGASWEASHV